MAELCAKVTAVFCKQTKMCNCCKSGTKMSDDKLRLIVFILLIYSW